MFLFSEAIEGDGKSLGYFPKSFESLCRTHAFLLWLALLLFKLVGSLLESRGVSVLPNTVLPPLASPCIPHQQHFGFLNNSCWWIRSSEVLWWSKGRGRSLLSSYH